MRKVSKSFIKVFLLLLFVFYMAGITLFTHSHIVNGVKITHSHPFKKGVEHNHSEATFKFIDQLNNVEINNSIVFFQLSAVILPLIAVSQIVSSSKKTIDHKHRISIPRAPPFRYL